MSIVDCYAWNFNKMKDYVMNNIEKKFVPLSVSICLFSNFLLDLCNY